MEEQQTKANILTHQSGVSPLGEPFVQILVNGKVIGQLSTADARDHARAMTEVAEAAEQDAFLFDWVQNKVGAGPVQAAGMIAEFREYREKLTGKRGGPTDPKDWVPCQ